MTSLEKIKYIKSMGFSLQFVSDKSGVSYHKMWRALKGGRGLNAAEGKKIDRVYQLVKAFENE